MTKKLIPLTVYIAGPMTGLPDFNRPAFRVVEQVLAKEGFHVLNPADNEANDWLGYMRRSLCQIADADIVFFLRGWRESKGASLEHRIAQELGLIIRYESDFATNGLASSINDQDLELMKLEGASTAELGRALMQHEAQVTNLKTKVIDPSLQTVVPYHELKQILVYLKESPYKLPAPVLASLKTLVAITFP